MKLCFSLLAFLGLHSSDWAAAFSISSSIGIIGGKPSTATASNTRLLLAAPDEYTPLEGEQRINRDGQHVKHNATTGDNVDPLIVSVPKAKGGITDNNKNTGKEAEVKSSNAGGGDDKKVQGRKKRVLIGYRATMIGYLAYAAGAMKHMGVSKFSLYQASGQVMAAGLAFILMGAAQKDRLTSDTYKRLNLCVINYGLVGLGMVAFATEFRTSPMFVLPPLFATINSVKGYAYGVLGWDKKGDASMVTDFLDGTKSTLQGALLSLPKNPKAAGYLAATATAATMTAAKLIELFQLVQDGTNGLGVATRLARFGRLYLLTSVLYTLKDAADRDRLDGSTFIELNVLSGIAFAAMSAYVGATTRLGGAAAVFSAFSAFNGVSSILKKRAKANNWTAAKAKSTQ